VPLTEIPTTGVDDADLEQVGRGVRADEHREAAVEVVDDDRMVDELTDQEDRRSRPGSWPSIDPG
jgi:hypothetical protein